jgi:hypothetical protein
MSDQYLDFELAFHDYGDGRYRATVTDCPLGKDRAFVDFSLPFASEQLQRILAVLYGQASVPALPRSQQARDFGEALFKAVFAGPVLTAYTESRERARKKRKGLRIKLVLDDAGDIAELPWEFLRDPLVDYLALSRSTPLVRAPSQFVARSRPSVKLPLRVLVMVSNPTDMEPVDVLAEWDNVQAATASLRTRGLLELQLLDDASLRTLQRELRAAEYHVFHYIGHSTFDTASGQGMLALEDPSGEGSAFPVRGEYLARELSEENTIRLVLLNSCDSAVGQTVDPFAGIASSIVTRGVPAVIAMQSRIGEQAAQAFSEEFYRALADGLPVDAAMAEARRAISYTVGGVEWATPVLFMRALDGALFDIQPRYTPGALLRRPVGWAALAVLTVLLFVVMLLLWQLNRADNGRDLAVERIEVIPERPSPGEEVAVIAHVQNLGKKAVGAFTYDFREDVLDAKPLVTGTESGLAPGESRPIVIHHRFSWWGPFVPEFRVDVNSAISETDEFNNTARTSVVTDDGAFVITFRELPDGTEISDAMQVGAASFALWGLRFEAVEGDDTTCASAIPWIVVDGLPALTTGLPDNPALCNENGLVVVFVRSPVGGVNIQFEGSGPYEVSALDSDGGEVGHAFGSFGPRGGELDIAGSFASRLEVARVVITGEASNPVRIRELAFVQRIR